MNIPSELLPDPQEPAPPNPMLSGKALLVAALLMAAVGIGMDGYFDMQQDFEIKRRHDDYCATAKHIEVQCLDKQTLTLLQQQEKQNHE